jgi:hypothetical protein
MHDPLPQPLSDGLTKVSRPQSAITNLDPLVIIKGPRSDGRRRVTHPRGYFGSLVEGTESLQRPRRIGIRRDAGQ